MLKKRRRRRGRMRPFWMDAPDDDMLEGWFKLMGGARGMRGSLQLLQVIDGMGIWEVSALC